MATLEPFKDLLARAEVGDKDAQYKCGEAYDGAADSEPEEQDDRDYSEVERDQKVAIEWYQKAAAQGHIGAHINLAYIYEHGKGVLKDEKKAMEWNYKAVVLGDEIAYFNFFQLCTRQLENLNPESAEAQAIQKLIQQAQQYRRLDKIPAVVRYSPASGFTLAELADQSNPSVSASNPAPVLAPTASIDASALEEKGSNPSLKSKVL